MAWYVVNCEYVPTDGAPRYADDELLPFAEAVRSALAEHKCSVHGAGERLVVAIELEAENERSARQRGIDLIFAGILSSGLRSYRLGTVEVSPET